MASDAPDVGAGRTADPDPLEAMSTLAGGGATGSPGLAAAVDPLEEGGVDELAGRHWRFVWPMTVFFLVYYMLLMWLPSVAPGFMGRKLVGNFTFRGSAAWVEADRERSSLLTDSGVRPCFHVQAGQFRHR